MMGQSLRSMNKVVLLGNVGNDPEMRQTQDGTAIGNFSIATSDTWKDQGGNRQSRTEWHRIVCFAAPLNKLIEGHVKKGDLVMVEGRIVTRKWQDQSGQDKYTTEIVLQPYEGVLKLLSPKPEGSGQGNYGGGGDYTGGGYGNNPGDGQSSTGDDIDDEIPF